MTAAAERRTYWLSIAALVVVLPLTAVVQSRGDIIDWLRLKMRTPVVVERENSQPYAGGQWRLAGLTKLPGDLPDTVVVLAEFEVAGDLAQLTAAGPCSVTLVDKRGWRWEPMLLTRPAIVREMRPDAVDKPRCGDFTGAESNGKVMVAEAFLIPSDAEGLTLSLSLGNALPDRLVFR